MAPENSIGERGSYGSTGNQMNVLFLRADIEIWENRLLLGIQPESVNPKL